MHLDHFFDYVHSGCASSRSTELSHASSFGSSFHQLQQVSCRLWHTVAQNEAYLLTTTMHPGRSNSKWKGTLILCLLAQHRDNSQSCVLLAQLKNWLATFNTKLERLFKYYSTMRSKNSFGFVQCLGSGHLVTPSEFLRIVKECGLTDSDNSMYLCLQVAMMAQHTQIDRYTCDGEYLQSLPVPDIKIPELFSISFEVFQRILGALAVAKDRNNANDLMKVLNCLVTNLFAECPAANELHLY